MKDAGKGLFARKAAFYKLLHPGSFWQAIFYQHDLIQHKFNRKGTYADGYQI